MWLFGKISRQRELCAKALRQELFWTVQSHVTGEEQGEEKGDRPGKHVRGPVGPYRALVKGTSPSLEQSSVLASIS